MEQEDLDFATISAQNAVDQREERHKREDFPSDISDPADIDVDNVSMLYNPNGNYEAVSIDSEPAEEYDENVPESEEESERARQRSNSILDLA